MRQLGRYELLEQLGEGGMGAVWLARLSGSHGFEKLCIVKTVLPSIAKDAEFVSRFLHEGRVLTQLAHGNIAQVLDMNEADGQLFLALEYVAGVDLAKLHENVRASSEFMPVSLVVALIAQAAEGLGAAHRKVALDGTPLHVVHRDVSPQNIMVSYEGEVKVIDFGIAKSEARSRHTAQASVMGKLGYMAPEQARGEAVDHRADQYALAIVLWELLANEPFIRRGTLTEMVVAMAQPTVRPLAPLRGDVPPSLEAVVLKALSPSPDARYPDTDAFARALTTEVLALGPPPTKPQLGEYVKSRCTQEFSAQRQLLTRVSTLRGLSTQAPQPLTSDPLSATAIRPGPPVATQPPSGQALTQATPPQQEGATVAARPSNADPSAVTRHTRQPTSAPDAGVPNGSGTGAPTRPEVGAVPARDGASQPAPVVQAGNAAIPEDQAAPLEPGAAEERRASPTVAEGSGAVARPAVSAPLTTAELAAALPRRSRLPLLLGGLAFAVLLVAVVATLLPEGDLPTAALDAGLEVAATTPVDAGPPVTTPVNLDAGDEELAGPAPAASDGGVIGPPPGFEEPPAPDATLRFLARAPPGVFIITNSSGKSLTGCVLTAPGQRTFKLGAFPKGTSREVSRGATRADPRAVKLERQLRIDCSQGSGVAKL